MAKTAYLAYREILTELRKKKYAPIYVLMGKEAYFIDNIADLLQKNVVAEEDRDFNQTILYGADASIDVIVNAARRYPVMSDRQIVMLKEAQVMYDSKNQLEKLKSYAEHPSLSTILVITYKGDSLKMNSSFIKAVVANGGVVFDSVETRDYQLDPILNDYCLSKKLKIDSKASAMLKEYVGTDLKRLFGEVDKLVVAMSPDDGNTISAELIERNIGISKDFNNFELVRAIRNRDFVRAQRILDYFEHNPKQNPTIITTAVLFKFFSELLIAHSIKNKGDAMLMSELGLKYPKLLEDTKIAMAAYSPRRCMSAISAIRKFDISSKGIGSTQNEYKLLKDLIFTIFTI